MKLVNFYKILLSTTLLVVMGVPARGKSTDWLVNPQYDQMAFFAPDLYKVMQNGKLGIIDTEGHTILSPEYDMISDFYEGIAIFGNYTSDGTLMKGTIGEDNKINFITGTYYIHNEYPFYSEGLIPVIDASGKYGYLNEKGRPAFKFGNDETRPFSEGFAAVGEGDEFHWITTTGEQMRLTLPNGSYPYYGTNFFNGIAYLIDAEGEAFFIIDESLNVIETTPFDLIVDYMYRLNKDTGKGSDIEYSSLQRRFNNTWKPTQRNGKWTYSDSKGNLLTKPQYEEADYFQGISARAKINGKWGLLHVVEDDATFFTKSDKKLHVFSSMNGTDCSFQLSVPDKWKEENFTVSVKDPETGEKFNVKEKNPNVYVFTYHPDNSKTTLSKIFEIEVTKDNEVVWQGEENYDFAQSIKLVASLSVKNKADANNRCFVTATISNKSSIPVSTTVTLTGGGGNSKFNPQTININIPANSKRSVTSAFILKGVELDGWCSVSTSDGAHARKNNLQLKPRD